MTPWPRGVPCGDKSAVLVKLSRDEQPKTVRLVMEQTGGTFPGGPVKRVQQLSRKEFLITFDSACG